MGETFSLGLSRSSNPLQVSSRHGQSVSLPLSLPSTALGLRGLGLSRRAPPTFSCVHLSCSVTGLIAVVCIFYLFHPSLGDSVHPSIVLTADYSISEALNFERRSLEPFYRTLFYHARRLFACHCARRRKHKNNSVNVINAL